MQLSRKALCFQIFLPRAWKRILAQKSSINLKIGPVSSPLSLLTIREAPGGTEYLVSVLLDPASKGTQDKTCFYFPPNQGKILPLHCKQPNLFCFLFNQPTGSSTKGHFIVLHVISSAVGKLLDTQIIPCER